MNITADYSGLKESLLRQLVSRIVVPEEFSAATTATFDPTVPDTLNPGTALTPDTPIHHSTFVENNLMGEV